jgi:hypothetical protein
MENQKPDDAGTPVVEEPKKTETQKFADKLSTVGWSLFLIWVGIALLMKLNATIVLLGIGVITLLVQGARKCFNLKLEGFWVVIGLLFVIGSLWEIYKPNLPLVPIVLIVLGVALLVSVIRRLMQK